MNYIFVLLIVVVFLNNNYIINVNCKQDAPKHGGPISNNTYNCVKRYDRVCSSDKVLAKHSISPLDLRTYADDMIDNKNKIMMSWTPKAGCTQAVLMFLDNIGFKDGVDFTGWPHDFRPAYYQRCGKISLCTYFDSNYYKFKVVRNPYDRAVSSFIHIMHSKIVPEEFLIKSIPGITAKGDITFKDYLTYVEANTLTPLASDLHDGSHVRKQTYDFEFYAWLEGKKVFDRIVKLESFAEDMALVNKESGAHFKTNFTSKHYAKRVEEDFYVGNMTFSFMTKHHEIPENYGLFYDDEDMNRVFRLFFTDLLVYNYSYPFPKNPWMK